MCLAPLNYHTNLITFDSVRGCLSNKIMLAKIGN